jgi:hypothetical protein
MKCVSPSHILRESDVPTHPHISQQSRFLIEVEKARKFLGTA